MGAVLIIVITSGALVAGAWIGVKRWLPDRVEGLLVAAAGGALIVSAVIELMEPAIELLGLPLVAVAVLLGAWLFSLADA